MASEIVFRAMADPSRQRALMVLRRQELNVSELVEVLNQPQSTVSRNLKILRDAGLIRDRREGNVVTYSVPEMSLGSNGTTTNVACDGSTVPAANSKSMPPRIRQSANSTGASVGL